MADQQHLITPPPELVQQWVQEVYGLEGMSGPTPGKLPLHVATQAARWGADQELEACVAWVDDETYGNASDALRIARRPKPPSLAEDATLELEEIMDELHRETGSAFTATAIRRALERLQELEALDD